MSYSATCGGQMGSSQIKARPGEGAQEGVAVVECIGE